MASAIGDLVVTLLGNAAPFRREIAGAQSAAGGFSATMNSMFGKVAGAGKSLLGSIGLGGMFGGFAVSGALVKSVSLAREQAGAEKKLAAVLTATGGAAGYTAQELYKYAGELQSMTNFGDEATIAGMALLATFTQIKGPVFKEATAAAQNMSAILGQDLNVSMMQLGKALNDPIKGVTALRRAGVSFTAQQLEQIKALQQSGDMVGAQRLILKELENEFGGAAKAMASPFTQLKNAIGDLGEQIGFAILPPLKAIAQGALWLTEKLGGVAKAAMGFAMVGVAAVTLLPLVTYVVSTIAAGFAMLLGPVGAVIAVVAGLGALFVQLTGEGETFGAKLQSVLAKIPAVVETVAFAFRNFGDIAQLALIGVALKAIEVFPGLEGPIANIAKFFIGTWAGIKAFFGSIIENMIGGLKELGNALTAVWEGIKAAWEAMRSGDWSGIASAFSDAFSQTLAAQQDVVAPNAFAAFGSAYADAANSFQQRMDQSGGFRNALEGQQKDLLDSIAQREAARNQAAETAGQKAAEEARKPAAAAEAAKTDKPSSLSVAAAERGSASAWSMIQKAIQEDRNGPAERAAKAAEKTADNTQRIADAIANDALEEGDF